MTRELLNIQNNFAPVGTTRISDDGYAIKKIVECTMLFVQHYILNISPKGKNPIFHFAD
jgi:hypothetical protein